MTSIAKSKTRLLFDLLINKKDRKSLIKIFSELIQLFILHRRNPSYYFGRHLYRSNRTNIRDYIPNKLLWSMDPVFNEAALIPVLDNKLFFNYYYGSLNINIPKILIFNHGKQFVVNNESVEVKDSAAFENIVGDLVKNKSNSASVFIKKTYSSYGGANTYRISTDQLPLSKSKWDELYKTISCSAYLFQETIRQHPQLNVINPSCINTIRFDTFIDEKGNVEIMSAYLRTSSNNLHADNGSLGGCLVGIELETGKLKNVGYTSFTKAGGKILTEHPVTKIVFEDFAIPYFEESKKLVIRAAGLIPGLRLIGWDVATGITGPILVEGNCGYDISINDLAFGGYARNQVFMKALNEFKRLN
jgi:hypothetical protein